MSNKWVMFKFELLPISPNSSENTGIPLLDRVGIAVGQLICRELAPGEYSLTTALAAKDER